MTPDFEGRNAENARAALTVSALNRAVSGLLQRSFPLVRVRGEIANVRARPADIGLCLEGRPSSSALRDVSHAQPVARLMPRDGDEVEVRAVVSLYEARGEFQLSVESMRRRAGSAVRRVLAA